MVTLYESDYLRIADYSLSSHRSTMMEIEMQQPAGIFLPPPPQMHGAQLQLSHIPAISELLFQAVNCVHDDEAIALDLMKRASALLLPDNKPARSRLSKSMPGGMAPWQVKTLIRHVEENIAGNISLQEMAHLVRLSQSYFSSSFKVSFGMSPHAYIVEQRIERAKSLMRSSDMPLCEVALDCGLSDQAHLTRLFRRVVGTTPGAWRRFQSTLSTNASLGKAASQSEGPSLTM